MTFGAERRTERGSSLWHCGSMWGSPPVRLSPPEFSSLVAPPVQQRSALPTPFAFRFSFGSQPPESDRRMFQAGHVAWFKDVDERGRDRICSIGELVILHWELLQGVSRGENGDLPLNFPKEAGLSWIRPNSTKQPAGARSFAPPFASSWTAHLPN